MKIEAGEVAVGQLQPDWISKQAGSISPASSQGVDGDRTTLSSDSTTVKSLVTRALNMPDVRREKVQALREAVSSGGYQVDPQKLASAMMSDC